MTKCGLIMKYSDQPKIKEEVEPVQISDYGASYQEFSFSSEPQYRSTASTSQAWPQHTQGTHSNEVSHINNNIVTSQLMTLCRV